MSLIASGVKVRVLPRTALPSASIEVTGGPPLRASRWRRSQDELAFGRLEAVVVPELAPAHELAERPWRLDPVDPELAAQQFVVGGSQPGLDAVHPERGDLAAHV